MLGKTRLSGATLGKTRRCALGIALVGLGACAEEGASTSTLGEGAQCVTVVTLSALWTTQEDGSVEYDPCYSCDGEGNCDVEDCCPSPWVFVGAGDTEFSTIVCALE